MKTKTKTEGVSTRGALRVWHIPQVPGKPFHVEIPAGRSQSIQIALACQILDALATYDLFQYENRIKPDYANAQGLEVFEDGEWIEWMDEDGNDIGELRRHQ